MMMVFLWQILILYFLLYPAEYHKRDYKNFLFPPLPLAATVKMMAPRPPLPAPSHRTSHLRSIWQRSAPGAFSSCINHHDVHLTVITQPHWSLQSSLVASTTVTQCSPTRQELGPTSHSGSCVFSYVWPWHLPHVIDTRPWPRRSRDALAYKHIHQGILKLEPKQNRHRDRQMRPKTLPLHIREKIYPVTSAYAHTA